eukprot:14431942-Alexandrium_andersonii.AAC.1
MDRARQDRGDGSCEGGQATHQAHRSGPHGPDRHRPGGCVAWRIGLVHPDGAGGHVLAGQLGRKADQQ